MTSIRVTWSLRRRRAVSAGSQIEAGLPRRLVPWLKSRALT